MGKSVNLYFTDKTLDGFSILQEISRRTRRSTSALVGDAINDFITSKYSDVAKEISGLVAESVFKQSTVATGSLMRQQEEVLRLQDMVERLQDELEIKNELLDDLKEMLNGFRNAADSALLNSTMMLRRLENKPIPIHQSERSAAASADVHGIDKDNMPYFLK